MAGRDDTDETRLDGNAAAGVLSGMFRCEPSATMIACSGCGRVGPIGSLLAYGLEMGAILRCPACDTAVLRAGATGGQLWVDLRGALNVRIEIGR